MYYNKIAPSSEGNKERMNKIQKLKHDNGLTSRQLADKLGVKKKTVAWWCTGGTVGAPSKNRIKAIFGDVFNDLNDEGEG